MTASDNTIVLHYELTADGLRNPSAVSAVFSVIFIAGAIFICITDLF